MKSPTKCPSCGTPGYDRAEGCGACGASGAESGVTKTRPVRSTRAGGARPAQNRARASPTETPSSPPTGEARPPTAEEPRPPTSGAIEPSSSPSREPSPAKTPDQPRGRLSFAPGERFGARYTVVDRVGEGGMGVVYKAHDRELDRTVALKMIRADVAEKGAALIRFRRELGIAQQVSHPNVCRVHDLGEAEGIRYLSMEYLEGRTLAELIREVGRLSTRQTLDFAEQICAGMEAVHAQGIVHRDLKPSNIGVSVGGRAVVMDFGIARRPFDAQITRPGTTVGSYAYLAPEQLIGGELDARTDIYAVGLLLYEMLTGQVAPGDSDPRPLAVRGEHAVCPPPSHHDPDVPPELDALVLRCLAWDREERPPDIGAVRSALEEVRARAGIRTDSGAGPLPGLAGLTRGQRRWVAAAAGIVVALLFISPPVWERLESLLPLTPLADLEGAQNIAVLPFQYGGEDTRYAYLGDLVAEAMIAGLQSVPGLAVAPYETILVLAQDRVLEKTPIAEIARALGVDRVAHGRVAVQDSQLVLQAQMTSDEGETVWQETVQGSLGRPLQAAETVRQSLLRALGAGESASAEPLAQIRTPRIEAYRKYLEARRAYDRWDVEESLAEAISRYRQAIEADPEFAVARAELAMALVTQFYQANDPSLIAAANEELRFARALGPELPEVLVATGFVEDVSGNSAQAEVALTRALELAPGSDSVYRIAGDFYAELGRHDEAKRMYERAVALRPGLWTSHYALGRYHFIYSGDLDTAREHLLKADEYHPGGAGPKLALGSIHLTRGDLDEAETWYRRVLELTSHRMAYYNLGLVHYYRGNYDLAIRSFRTALERTPERPLYQATVGHALRWSGDAKAAGEYYTRALELYRALLADRPHFDEERSELATLLAALGQCDEAMAELETVLSGNPESAEFASQGVTTAMLCGDRDRATRLALQAIAAGSVDRVRFDPDLERLRQEPAVREALAQAGLPVH